MPESLEVGGLNTSHGAVFGVWDFLFFADLCLGGGNLTNDANAAQSPKRSLTVDMSQG